MADDRPLVKLLRSLFNPDQLRHWLRWLPGGRNLLDRITPGLAPAVYFTTVVDELEQDGLPASPAFWDALIAERPLRKADTVAVRALVIRDDAPAVLTVLMVSACPDSQVRLRVDREFRQVVSRVQAAPHRDRLRIEPVLAARFDDLGTALMRHQPHVLHLSSHGEPDGTLVFEGDMREHRVPRDNLLALLRSLHDNLRLVVLNACHSHVIARDLPPTVDLAIGMSDNVRDRDAIEFSYKFYESLAFARNVENAFDIALSGLDDRGAAVPQLFPSADRDPGGKRKLQLVRP